MEETGCNVRSHFNYAVNADELIKQYDILAMMEVKTKREGKG